MNSKQFRFNHRRVSPLVLAILLLVVTAMPALAWNDQKRLDDQPVRCWRVLTTDPMMESDDCFGPGHFPRFPELITQSLTSSPKVESDTRVQPVVGGTGH